MFITEALSWKTAISPLMCIQASIGILSRLYRESPLTVWIGGTVAKINKAGRLLPCLIRIESLFILTLIKTPVP